MPKLVEVDEDVYQRMSALANVANQIYQNPEGRLLLEQAQKKVNPNAPTPAIDAHNAMVAPLEEVNKKISELTSLITKDREDRETDSKISKIGQQQDEAFAKLRANSGYTDAGIEAVKKVMAEKAILDPIDAAIIWERREPAATIATPTGSNAIPLIEKLTADTDGALKDLLNSRGENPQALDKLISASLEDFRAGR